MHTSPCPVSRDTAMHQRGIDAAASREDWIEKRKDVHATALLETLVSVFDESADSCTAATIDADVTPLLCDVISANYFDVLSAEVLFALNRLLSRKGCAEQKRADWALLKKFANYGQEAIDLASERIAEKEWEVTHGS